MIRITLGELAYKLEMECLRRSKDCVILLGVTEDGDEYIHIRGDGLVTAIPLTRPHPAEKHRAERDFEKRMIKQFIFFNKLIEEEIKTSGFIDEKKLEKILDKQVDYFKEISKG